MAGFFGMFNFDKPGRGVDKNAPKKRGFFLFFDLYLRKFWRIITLSFSYTLLSVPALVIFFFLSTLLQSMISPIQDPAFITYMGIYCSLFLVSIVGTGPASAGHAYVLRNFAREDHAWVWEDFWTKTKENFWQGLLVFLLDIVLLLGLTGAAYLYLAQGAQMPMPPMVTMVCGFFAIIALIVYIMMHFFIYPLMVTFRMKFGTLLKTALQLTMAHLPQCIGMLILCIAVFALFLALYFLNIAFIIAFAALGFSTITFAYVFFATDIIDRVPREE